MGEINEKEVNCQFQLNLGLTWHCYKYNNAIFFELVENDFPFNKTKISNVIFILALSFSI